MKFDTVYLGGQLHKAFHWLGFRHPEACRVVDVDHSSVGTTGHVRVIRADGERRCGNAAVVLEDMDALTGLQLPYVDTPITPG